MSMAASTETAPLPAATSRSRLPSSSPARSRSAPAKLDVNGSTRSAYSPATASHASAMLLLVTAAGASVGLSAATKFSSAGCTQPSAGRFRTCKRSMFRFAMRRCVTCCSRPFISCQLAILASVPSEFTTTGPRWSRTTG
eukprot:scaffold13393_cov66-Phaeocystis_antarctica.AAC.4